MVAYGDNTVGIYRLMKRMTDLGGFKPAVLIMVSVLAFIAGSRSAELTGLVEFSTDSSGNFFNGSVWNTRGGDTAVNLWVAQGTNSSGPFLNRPTDSQAGISLPPTLGENTFTFVATAGGFTPNHGLNLFFNGDNTNPRISVFAPTQTSNPPPAFSVNASASTLTLAFRPVAAANSLVFIHGDQRIELTDYR